jgi:asparagine synthase (glutamine-hydrolysing)
LVPDEVLARPKQPYRAPDAFSFAGAAAAWLDDLVGDRAVAAAGIFRVEAARQLVAKCRARAGAGQFSNADNMAVVGVVSTQLVYDHFIRQRPGGGPPVRLKTEVDLVAGSPMAER